MTGAPVYLATFLISFARSSGDLNAGLPRRQSLCEG